MMQATRKPRSLAWSRLGVIAMVLVGAPSTRAVEEAISMVRIQHASAADGAVAAVSTDGRSVAFVTWRGDLARDTNEYAIRVLRIAEAATRPETLVQWDFDGDNDQRSAPFAELTFLSDNRTLAFLGRKKGAPAQVFTVDIQTKEVRQLTQHPTAVRAFIVGPGGSVCAYSAVATEDSPPLSARPEAGVFLWDDLQPGHRLPYFSSAPFLSDPESKKYRQYFVSENGAFRLFFDSRQSRPAPSFAGDSASATSPGLSLADEGALSGWASLTGDFQGKQALLFPYGLTDHGVVPERFAHYQQRSNPYMLRTAAPYGVVDLSSGRIDRLLDAPHPQFAPDTGDPLWLPDGKSVIIHTLLPDFPAEPPQWTEIVLATRAIRRLEVPAGWKLVSWSEPGRTLVLQKGAAFARYSRFPNGTYGGFTELGTARGFSPQWSGATFGKIVVGVIESNGSPPELACYDFETKQTRVLTSLNPHLRENTHGGVQILRWDTPSEKNAFGYLVKPVGHQTGRRYPLVVLLDDNTMRRNQEARPYLLDAVGQLAGHAIQQLAAEGFMVLYPHSPILRDVVQTAKEGARYGEYIESAIAKLDEQGLIEPSRVGLSGWSRAAYHTEYLLIHSKLRFAAASAIDGGSFEYTDRMRPFWDSELEKIHTPLLFQPHGLPTLVAASNMADRMAAMGKATEILYFATASHQTTRPQHRFRSLDTHLDWWKFWLKDEESSDPAKAEQMRQWRKLRAMRDADLKKAAEQGSATAP